MMSNLMSFVCPLCPCHFNSLRLLFCLLYCSNTLLALTPPDCPMCATHSAAEPGKPSPFKKSANPLFNKPTSPAPGGIRAAQPRVSLGNNTFDNTPDAILPYVSLHISPRKMQHKRPLCASQLAAMSILLLA